MEGIVVACRSPLKQVALFAALCTSLVRATDLSVTTGRSFGFIQGSADGTVLAMGKNTHGQLGVNTGNTSEPVPIPVQLPEEVAGVSAGAFHSLFVTVSGEAYSTGRNNFGQLGYSTNGGQSVPMPKKIEGLIVESDDPNVTTPHVTAVAAGYGHSVFLLSDGSVRAVGLNNQGQLGDGTMTSTDTIVAPNLGEPVMAIAAGYDFTYFLTRSGDVYATGNNFGGQLGDGTQESQTSPVKVLSDVTAISAGEAHGLFVSSAGELMGTGANFDGQIGAVGNLAARPTQSSPMAVAGAFAGGDSSAFLNSDDDSLWALGSNRLGQLGLGNITVTSVAMQIGAAEAEAGTFKEAAIASTHGFFVSLAGFVYAAGDNSDGQFGDGTYEGSSHLVETYKSLPITRTATLSTTLTVTGSVTTTEEGGEGTTATMTETATATETVSATRGGQNTAGPSRRDMVRLIVIVSILGLILAAVLLQCCCSRGGAPSQESAPLTIDKDKDLELARAQMSV